MNCLDPIPVIEKWTRKNSANNFLLCFFCLFILFLSGSLNAQTTILCPQDIQTSVSATACSATVDYDVLFDNPDCTSMAFTQNVDNNNVTMSIGCTQQLGSQHIRVFDFNAMGISGPLALQSIDLGIGYAPAGSNITINFYTLSGAVDYSNMTLISTQVETLPAIFNGVLNIPTSVTAPAGAVLVVEAVIPPGPNVTLVGYNDAGETAPSYYASQGASLDPLSVCGYAQPVTTGTLGFGAFHMVLTLNSDPMSNITQLAGLPAGSVFPLGVTTNTFQLTDICGNTDQCSFDVSVIDDIAPLFTCPTPAPVYLPNGQCDAVVNFAVSATDGCSGAATVSQTGGAYSTGDTFPVGTHILTYSASDATGNSSSCQVEVVIHGTTNAGGDLGCNNDLQLPLGPNCEYTLDALTLLQSGYDCNANYTVYAVDNTGNIIGDVIGGIYAGQTLQVIISEAGGNKCWGFVTIVDGIAPTINCSDVNILCNDSDDPADIGQPNYYDNCNHVSLSHVDAVTGFGCNDPYKRIIERTWTATDYAGNSASCVQNIYVSGVDINDVVFPGNYDDSSNPSLECNSSVNTSTAVTGVPTINGQAIVNGDLCGLAVIYSDQSYDLCGGSYKILRTWTVEDWCANQTVTHIQIIKVLDKVGPQLACPPTIQVPTSPNACSATFLIPMISVTDDCSDVEVIVSTDDFDFQMNGGTAVNLELGAHTLVYTATDDCNNQNSCTLNVEVFDNIPPIAICDSYTTVSLDQFGEAMACATTFDDGSYDNCADVVLKVKRTDAAAAVDYDDCVDFNCSDIGNVISVNMRIYDITGTFAENDPTARYNECTVEVTVTDNIAPIVSCPDDIVVGCEQDPTDHSIVGVATLTDICGVDELQYTDEDFRDDCGEGYLLRTYFAADLNGNNSIACVQTISFLDVTPVVIDFPNDYAANNCTETGELIPENLPAQFSFPVISGNECELVDVHYEDELFSSDPSACYKIYRHWKVVEWCKFDANDPAEPGVSKHTQVISVSDNIPPVIISGCEDNEFCSYDDDCETGLAELFFQATDNCLMPELLTYHFAIDLYSDGSVDVSAPTPVATGNYPLGVHTIVWTVTDGCGNASSCTKEFKISDCKKPTPVCINGLSTDIQPFDGVVSIVPLDLESGSSFDNCTDYDDLVFSFSSDVSDQSKTFDCDDFGTQIVEIWITDLVGNQDFCQTYVIVQDNNNVCQVAQNAEISGYIETEDQDMVEDVNVQITNSNALPYTTVADGQFAFPSILLNNNYSIQPEKDVNPLNGVTTLDLVLIQQHIIGVNTLNSPYKIIAADANKSNSVTTLDIVQLRRLILDIDQDFQSNNSWRFVDMDFVFPNPTNPFVSAFPEQIDFNNIASSELATDFVGVKIGDVNGTALANNLLGSEGRNFVGTLNFNLDNQQMEVGEEYTVDFKASDFNNLLGYQFTIEFDAAKMEMVDMIPGALENLTESNFNFSAANSGVISTSWSNATALTVEEDAVLFSIKFKAIDATILSDVLSVSSKITKAESYNSNADLLDVAFNFDNLSAVANAQIELFQNQPNPFTESTDITFNLPSSSEVTLTITDVAGKVLKVVNGDFAKGFNAINISKNDLNGSGVLFYRLDSNDFTATKKMLHIK